MMRVKRSAVLLALSAIVMMMQLSVVPVRAEELPTVESNAVCQHVYQSWECRKQRLNPISVSHKYGLFWTSTCNTTVYHSTVRHFCAFCKADMPWLDTNEQHECVQVHHDCGDGTVSICTIIGP